MRDIRSLNESYPELKISVKRDYSEIKLSQELESKFDMELNYKDNSWLLTSHNLPNRITFLKVGAPTSLKRAVEGCKAAIENLVDYFEVFETIDRNSEVLEPVEPTPKDNWRIIKFSKYLYIKIELPNPLNIKDANVSFYGKQELVEKMSDLYNKLESDEENVYWRLHCLKYDLDDEDMDDEEKIDCGICLDFYNEIGQCPIIFCANTLCSQAFHIDCLSRHLKASNIKVLNVAVGECPYCKFKIQANFIKDEQKNVSANESDIKMESSE